MCALQSKLLKKHQRKNTQDLRLVCYESGYNECENEANLNWAWVLAKTLHRTGMVFNTRSYTHIYPHNTAPNLHHIWPWYLSEVTTTDIFQLKEPAVWSISALAENSQLLFMWVWRVNFLKTIIGCQLGDQYFLGNNIIGYA